MPEVVTGSDKSHYGTNYLMYLSTFNSDPILDPSSSSSPLTGSFWPTEYVLFQEFLDKPTSRFKVWLSQSGSESAKLIAIEIKIMFMVVD